MEPFAREPIPLLILSDAPSSGTGLGRIARDLATRVHAYLPDVFRVATLGYGGPGSRHLGFMQYTIEGMQEWVVPTLPQVWDDFASGQKGICMTIWDPSRLMWFSQPAHCEMLESHPVLRNWLAHVPFERWGYFPVDAAGPNGKLSFPLQKTILGFDRMLAYGAWAEQVLRRSLQGNRVLVDIGHRPHGIDTGVFYPRDRDRARFKFGSLTGARLLVNKPTVGSILADELLIGIVATNQTRKDWALAIEAVADIAQQRKLRLWIHTDGLERTWSIPALLADYGLVDCAMVSLGYLSDDVMAQAYSACDVTLGIGLGEGFGFPLAESLACGTPVVHGNYAGGAEIVPAPMRVEPVAWRTEGLYNCLRPVFEASDWAARLLAVAGTAASLDPRYDWNNLWPRWETWFREGIAD